MVQTKPMNLATSRRDDRPKEPLIPNLPYSAASATQLPTSPPQSLIFPPLPNCQLPLPPMPNSWTYPLILNRSPTPTSTLQANCPCSDCSRGSLLGCDSTTQFPTTTDLTSRDSLDGYPGEGPSMKYVVFLSMYWKILKKLI